MRTLRPAWLLFCLTTLCPRQSAAQGYEFVDCISAGPVNIYGSRDMAGAPDGSVYVVGSYTTGTFSITGQSVATTADDAIFLAKFNEDLVLQWLLPLADNPNFITSTPMATMDVDQEGNLIVGIGFMDTLQLFGEEVIPAGGEGIVLMKLNVSGDPIWWHQIDADRLGKQGVAVDNEGNVLVAGEATEGMFTAKYSTTGDLLWWTPSHGNGDSELPWGVQCDDLGNVYALGNLPPGGATFGALEISFPLGCFNVGSLAKYDPAGAAQWVRYVYSQTFAQYSVINSVICVGTSVFVGGSYSDAALRFSNGGGTYGPQPSGFNRSFLAEYGSNGDLIGVKVPPYSGSGSDGINSLATDGSTLHSLVSFQNSIEHDLGPIDSYGSNDILLQRCGLNGEMMSNFQIGSSAMDGGNHLIHHAGHIYILGATNGLSLTSPADCSVAAGANMFVMRFNSEDVGITDHSGSSSIQVHPNPSHGIFTVQTPPHAEHITVSDALGRVILQNSIRWSEAGVQVDLGSAQPGLYWVRTEGKGLSLTTKMLVW